MTGILPNRFAHPDPEPFAQSGGPGRPVPTGPGGHFRPLPEEPARTFYPSQPGDTPPQRVVLPAPRPESQGQSSPFELVKPPPPAAADAPKHVTSAVRLPAVVSPVVNPEPNSPALNVSVAPVVPRTPLAPLIEDAVPAVPTAAHLPMTPPTDPLPLTSPVQRPAVPNSPPTLEAAPSGVPAPGRTMSGEDDFGMDFRQLELRAVFGLAQVLSPGGVFGLCSTLPGIKAAAYLAGDSLVFQHAPTGTSLATVPKAFIHLSALARDLGIRDTRLLTLQTEGGLLAFFSEGAGCLAVLHEGRRFAPGVKERLVIILRELSRADTANA